MGRDEDLGPLEALETVNEHRAVLLSENVLTDLDDQVQAFSNAEPALSLRMLFPFQPKSQPPASSEPRPGVKSQDMTREELLSRITINPDVCFGKPCIRGHRIWVSLILDFLAAGQSVEEILNEYPGLEEADILACIAYGAEMARERYVEVPLSRRN